MRASSFTSTATTRCARARRRALSRGRGHGSPQLASALFLTNTAGAPADCTPAHPPALAPQLLGQNEAEEEVTRAAQDKVAHMSYEERQEQKAQGRGRMKSEKVPKPHKKQPTPRKHRDVFVAPPHGSGGGASGGGDASSGASSSDDGREDEGAPPFFGYSAARPPPVSELPRVCGALFDLAGAQGVPPREMAARLLAMEPEELAAFAAAARAVGAA